MPNIITSVVVASIVKTVGKSVVDREAGHQTIRRDYCSPGAAFQPLSCLLFNEPGFIIYKGRNREWGKREEEGEEEGKEKGKRRGRRRGGEE